MFSVPPPSTRRPRDAVAEIDTEAKFYSSFDATNGYFLIPLHAASQHLYVHHVYDALGTL
jgi:hypothetical protein